jgi:hypothetical protein
MVKNGGKSVLTVVALGMLSVSTEIAWSAENPSPGETAARAISERNAFNLTSEPPPTRETAPPEPPRSEDIMLTGIYLHKGVERAALARVDTKKKAEPPTYLQLVAGEKKDGIEIVSIDKATGKVTIKEFGELRSLSFKENTFKTSVAKAPRTSSRSSSSTAAKKANGLAARAGATGGVTAAVTDGRIPFNPSPAPSDKKAEPFGSALGIIQIINSDYSAMETS